MYCIGNLFIGERFSEPNGQGTMTNDTTGEHAEYTFYKRKMFGNKQDDIQSVRGTIFDSNKQPTYTFEGKFTETVSVRRIEDGQKIEIFRKPNFVATEQETKKIWGFNRLSMQLNYCPEELKTKLPPSDTRLRPDMIAWENAEF